MRVDISCIGLLLRTTVLQTTDVLMAEFPGLSCRCFPFFVYSDGLKGDWYLLIEEPQSARSSNWALTMYTTQDLIVVHR